MHCRSTPPVLKSDVIIDITDGENPISNATVTIGTTSETTNNKGRAIFEDLDNGTYSISVSKSGYQTYTSTVTLIGDRKLDIVLNHVYSVSCTVTDGTDPLQGAVVTLTDSADNAKTYVSGATGSAGGATIANVPNGTYDVTAVLAGYSDSKFIDRAVTDKKNTHWASNSEQGDTYETVGDEYTTITLKPDKYYRAEYSLTTDFEILLNATITDTIKFDLVSADKSARVNASTTGLYRIRRVGNDVTFELSTDNGTNWTALTKTTDTLTNETCKFRFLNSASDERSLQYHDFIIKVPTSLTVNGGNGSVSIEMIEDN